MQVSGCILALYVTCFETQSLQSLRACVRVCDNACVRACVRACVPAFVRACVRSFVRACERACVRACVRASNEVVTFIVFCVLIATKRCIAGQVFDPLDSSRNESSASFRMHLGSVRHLYLGSVVGIHLLPVRVNFFYNLSSGGLS